MDLHIFLWASAALIVLFFSITLLRKAGERIDAWQKVNPFKFALIAAILLAIVIAVLAHLNQDFIECWKFHGAQCIFDRAI